MTSKPEDWCKQKFEDEKEDINDWVVSDLNAYDPLSGSLKGSFKRKLIGSSEGDYTFFPNKRY